MNYISQKNSIYLIKPLGHSKCDKIFQKSSKTPLQRRGEKNPQKIKEFRLKLLKCEKAEN